VLVELEAEQPTWIVEARTVRGEETAGVRVLVDGQLVRERLDGIALPVDPGEHVVRVEVPGLPTAEQRVVAKPGEKDRRIVFDMVPPAPPSPAPLVEAALPPAHTPASVYVLGGAAVLAAASFTTFAVLGKSLENDRASTCKPRCSDAQVAPVHVDYAVADASLAAAVVLAGAATWVFVASRAHEPHAVAFGVGPAPGGAAASLRVRF
jgi:hypothetical protein